METRELETETSSLSGVMIYSQDCESCGRMLDAMPTGRNAKKSPAWAMADEVVRLYKEKNGHKTIARRLNISPRITREILIHYGVYAPGTLIGTDAHLKKILAGNIRWRLKNKPAKKIKPKGRRSASGSLPLFAHASAQRARLRSKNRFAQRYKNDHVFRILHCLRKRLNKVAKRGRGYSGDNVKWLGCTPIELKAHLESLFLKGMTWDNYGSAWHIDHIIPCAAFDLNIESERLKCFHWTNLQPLWAEDNIRKSDILGSWK